MGSFPYIATLLVQIYEEMKYLILFLTFAKIGMFTAQRQNTVRPFLVLFQLQNCRFIGLGMNVRIFAEGAHI